MTGELSDDWVRRLLPLLADGLSNREIAKRLGISEGTVKNYTNGLYLRLGARNRAHAVALGYATGYLAADVAIGITDEAVKAVASAICRHAEPGRPYTLTPNMTWTEAEMYLAAGVPHLRLVPSE